MATVPIIPTKAEKPIVRVSPQQFLANRDVLMSPLIDCRVVVWVFNDWDPYNPTPEPPRRPMGTRPKYKVIA